MNPLPKTHGRGDATRAYARHYHRPAHSQAGTPQPNRRTLEIRTRNRKTLIMKWIALTLCFTSLGAIALHFL